MKYYIIVLITLLLSSCNWAKQKTKQTVNKTGEVVAKAGSEFVNGVSKGIEKTFDNEIELPDDIKNQGIELGKILITSSENATDNIVSIYFIFNNDFEKELILKVVNESGQEYGRKTELVNGKKGEAKYIDFIFDTRTNIDSKGKLIFKMN